jgi:drug/metabolite transporter (DMT)-like permease
MGGNTSEVEKNGNKDEPSHREETTTCSNVGVITFVVGLISGTFSALLCKMSYDTSSVGLDGNPKLFAKPIMMLLLMFTAMVPSMFFWLIQQHFLTKKEDRIIVPYKTMAILVIPSVCDLLCTTLLLIAQLYITASLWQMMRGSVIIITALLKRFALNHRLKLHMWVGVSIITLAMLLVASTSFFSSDAEPTSNGKDPRIGVLLVFIGCLAQGVQCEFLSLDFPCHSYLLLQTCSKRR